MARAIWLWKQPVVHSACCSKTAAHRGHGAKRSFGGMIKPQQVSIDTQGLPYSWQANLVPATPYDASQPPGPMGLPQHMRSTSASPIRRTGSPATRSCTLSR